MLAKTKPADLLNNLGKLHTVGVLSKGEIRENWPVLDATILPRKQLKVIDRAAATERVLGYWFYTFVFGGFGLLTLFAMLAELL
jgi:hypothetical protein